MPLDRYYHLEPEKRQVLMRAARKEFSRVPFHKASINQIIKDAGISRGSFYTYFQSKDDLMSHMLADFRQNLNDQLIHALVQADGDIFQAFIQLYDSCILYCEKLDGRPILQSFFSSINLMSSHDFSSITHIFSHVEYQEFFSRIDRDRLNLQASDDLSNALDILFVVTRYAISQFLCKPTPPAHHRERFLEKIRLLEEGMGKDA